jgi:purine-binding chemotaxis protein CheW
MISSEGKYIVYRVGSVLYGSPLLSVREVLEFQQPKFMPNMVQHFSGVINVRGAVVGVIDLRKKFAVDGQVDARSVLLLCDTNRGPIAAIVDGVECVEEFKDCDIEKNPPISTQVDTKYLQGVAKRKDDLITLIDLHESLACEQFKAA